MAELSFWVIYIQYKVYIILNGFIFNYLHIITSSKTIYKSEVQI